MVEPPRPTARAEGRFGASLGAEARLAGHTYSYRDVPLAVALDEIAALGLDGAEVWIGHAREGPAAVARSLCARGLRAVAVGAGGFYDDAAGTVRPAAELALAVGAPLVVACTRPDLVGRLERRLPAGLTLCVENHWDQRLATPGQVARALASGERSAACLDTGHALLAGVSPERFAASLGSLLGHVHLKEARRPRRRELALGRRLRRRLLERPKPLFPGSGSLDLRALRAALEAIGYRGAVSLEHEGADAGPPLAALLAQWRAVGRVVPRE